MGWRRHSIDGGRRRSLSFERLFERRGSDASSGGSFSLSDLNIPPYFTLPLMDQSAQIGATVIMSVAGKNFSKKIEQVSTNYLTYLIVKVFEIYLSYMTCYIHAIESDKDKDLLFMMHYIHNSHFWYAVIEMEIIINYILQ